MVEPSVVESKTVEPGPVPSTDATVGTHVTASHQLDRDLILRADHLVYGGHGTIGWGSCLRRISGSGLRYYQP